MKKKNRLVMDLITTLPYPYCTAFRSGLSKRRVFNKLFFSHYPIP